MALRDTIYSMAEDIGEVKSDIAYLKKSMDDFKVTKTSLRKVWVLTSIAGSLAILSLALNSITAPYITFVLHTIKEIIM